MQTVSNIPPWGPDRLIPPVDADDPVSTNRSPYLVTLSELVERFGTTDERLLLLDGLVRYRSWWHQAGLTQGFQWIDGSFVEDKETLRGSPPGDIDIVTFFEIPRGLTERELVARHGELFVRPHIKSRFRIDTYFVVLDPADLISLVENAVYWSSLFAHTKDNQWKGFVQIDLAQQDDDVVSRAITARLNKEN